MNNQIGRLKLYCTLPVIVMLLAIGQSVAQKTNTRAANVNNVSKEEHQNTSPSDKELKIFNKVSISQYIDTCNQGQGEPFRILVVGNSIAFHGRMDKIGWYHNRGMAASKLENDYAHLIFQKIEKILPDKQVYMRIKNLAKFERNFSTYDFAEVDSLVSYHADVIIFQLGENVKFSGLNTPDLLNEKYSQLINYIKKDSQPIVICTLPFFPALGKNKVIEQVALSTGSYLADLSHLSLDDQNYAKNEGNYPGDKSVWKVDGIGRHPGDYGMQNIAQQIFIAINATIKK